MSCDDIHHPVEALIPHQPHDQNVNRRALRRILTTVRKLKLRCRMFLCPFLDNRRRTATLVNRTRQTDGSSPDKLTPTVNVHSSSHLGPGEGKSSLVAPNIPTTDIATMRFALVLRKRNAVAWADHSTLNRVPSPDMAQ